MPTLIRLVIYIALLAALVYGAMWAMATYLHPTPHMIIEPISLPKQVK